MCAALLLPNCRDAFLRLSQLPSLRDRRFYSAILLAETQECVSTSFRRTHVIYSVSSRKSLASKEDTVFLASNFRWQGIYARILPQNFAGKKFTRVSCSKSSLGRCRGAILAPNPRWEGIVARFLPQILAGKVSRRDSCPKSSLGRYRGAILVPNPRWEGIAARFLPQILAGKVSRRDSCPKSSLGRNLRAILAPNLRWEGVAARFLSQILAGKVSRRDSCSKSSLGRNCRAILAPNLRWEGVAAQFLPPGGGDMPPAAVETWRAASPSSYRAAAHTGRTRASRESASRGDVARRVSTSWTRKRRNPARPRGAAARERGRRSPAPPRRYRSILPPSEVTLATISSSPARLWSPGMVFLRALAERAKSRHRWLSSPHLPRACM